MSVFLSHESFEACKAILLERLDVNCSDEFKNIFNLVRSLYILDELLCVASDLSMISIGDHV